MLVRAGPVIAAACLTIGCYNYLPVGRSHLAPATDLAITLTETGSVELERYLGRDVHVVRGHYLSASDQGLSVSVTSVETRRGDLMVWKGETVVVPGNYVRLVEERRVSPSKTFLFAGVGLAGLVAVYTALGPGSAAQAASGGAPPSAH